MLTLPPDVGDSDQAGLHRMLADARGLLTARTSVVLDARAVGVVSARMARTVVAFAEVGVARGIRCAVVLQPGAAARVALDLADPKTLVAVYGRVEEAIGGSEAPAEAPSADIVDPEVAEQVLSDSYATVRIRARGARCGMWMTSVPVGGVRLDGVGFRMGFDAEVAPLGKYVFSELESGRVACGAGGAWRRYGAGDVFLPAQPDLPYRAAVDDGVFRVAVIEPATLEHVARTESDRSGPIRVTGHEAVSAAAAAYWRSTCRHLRDDLLANPEVLAHPLVVGNAARLLAAAALATFANTARTDPTIEDRHDATPRTLRTAIAYIEAHADQDISVADIACSAWVTVRAVQLAFRRHLDTTPMAYLRRVRLDHVRAELRAAVPGQETVTGIAARWGFSRPGAFAAYYREVFDELPSHTLRNN
ncbi:AraC-like DNA-binding protein [Actinokineospora auranticolor]|uniref:AraC-like DNA-binding protein n=1 Tax=Actinokineospora auranticolor TaxID=155976 RepID=A0A2S6GPG6_9PSEU|nr:AraC-like DNA-binding protein [Actinokineospora auranticolor]